MAYTRRQELTCTEAQMHAKPNVVLRENESIYIKMNDGTLRQKIGDGVTTIINLPFTQVFDGSVVQTTGNSETAVMSQKAVTEHFSLVDVGEPIEGYYIGADGLPKTSENFRCSDYIDIECLRQKTVKFQCRLIGNASIAFYNTYRELISSHNGNTLGDNTKYSLSIPEQAKYVRFSTHISTPFRSCGIFFEKTSESLVEMINEAEVARYRNLSLVDVGEPIEGGYIGAYGNVQTDQGFEHSDYIDIEHLKNQTVVVKCSFRANAGIAFYDEYYSHISTIDGNAIGTVEECRVTIPNTAKYIRFSCRIGRDYQSCGIFFEKPIKDLTKMIDSKHPQIPNLSDVLLRQTTKISNFDADEWTQGSDASTGTIENDTVHVKTGSKSLKVTANAGQQIYIDYRMPNMLPVKDALVLFRAYVENLSNLDRVMIYFGMQGVGLPDYMSFYTNSFSEGWCNVDPKSYGQVSFDTKQNSLENVNWVRIMVKAKTTGAVSVTFDRLATVKNALENGCVVLAFDDAHGSVYDLAKPVMDKHGVRGVIYTIRDLVGKGDYMTLEELKTCYEDGWDISTHSQRPLSSYATAEQVREELLYNRDFLIDNGFVDSAYHFASHQGNYNAQALAEIKKLFRTHRSTVFGYSTIPCQDRYQIRNVGGNEGDLAYLKGIADYTKHGKYCTFMNWHKMSYDGSNNTGNIAIFDAFLAYLKKEGISVVTVSDIFGGNMIC